MEDWLRQFKDNLQNRPEPGFDERDWLALQRQLDSPGKRRKFAAAWWLLALPLLLLLASNVWFFSENRHSQAKLAALEQRYEQVLALRPYNYRDTVFVKQVVYHKDTIYLTRIVREYLPGYAFAENSRTSAAHPAAVSPDKTGAADGAAAQNPNDLTSQNEAANAAPPNQNKAATAEATGLNVEEKTAENQPVEWHSDRIEDPEIAPLTWLKTHYPFSNLPDVQAPEKKKTLAQKLYSMRPKHLRLGLAGGWVVPSNATVKNEGGVSASLEANVVFSPKLSLWTEVSYINQLYSSNQMGDELGIPFMQSPLDQYIFLEAEAPQKSIQYAAGMQYFFYANGKWKPFVGVGLGSVSLFTYDINYGFRNSVGLEINAEKEISPRYLPGEILLLRGGLEHEFLKNWNWQVRGSWRYNLKDKGLNAQNGLVLQVGLMRKF